MIVDLNNIMATATLSAQDKKDLDKFTKFLALKSTQIIVQSRLGEKLQTKCKLPQASSIDWFNLAIYDLPDVSTEAKKALIGDMAIAKSPLCVEISLRTVDGYQMILETWTLGISTDNFDPTVKVTCTVYNRMGMLLKTLISVTRITPAYKLSRQQSSDSYVIYYRIYSGEPQIGCLGEKFREVRVGQLDTPGGTIYMTVAFRTEMRRNQVSEEAAPIVVKSNHFLCEQRLNLPEKKKERKVNLDEPLKRGAFVDSSKVKEFTQADFAMPEEPAFLSLFDMQHKSQDKKDEEVKLDQTEDKKDQQESSHPQGIPIKQPYWSKLMQDDAVPLTDMHFPFASSSGSPMTELAQFYKDVSTAPALFTFSSDSSGTSQNTSTNTSPDDPEVSDVTEQLALFETSLQEYDSMVSSLCATDASATTH